MLRFFAKPIIWISILGTGGGLLALGLFLQSYYGKHYGEGSDGILSERMSKWVKAGYIALYCLTGFFFLVVLCMFKNIRISVAVLETAAVIVIRNIRVLIIPFVSIAVIVSYIAVWLFGLGYLLSCANITQPTDGSQLKKIDLDGKDQLKWQIAVWVFGLFWIAELLNAIFKYMLIVGVC